MTEELVPLHFGLYDDEKRAVLYDMTSGAEVASVDLEHPFGVTAAMLLGSALAAYVSPEGRRTEIVPSKGLN
jgi:hypothetical protein